MWTGWYRLNKIKCMWFAKCWLFSLWLLQLLKHFNLPETKSVYSTTKAIGLELLVGSHQKNKQTKKFYCALPPPTGVVSVSAILTLTYCTSCLVKACGSYIMTKTIKSMICWPHKKTQIYFWKSIQTITKVLWIYWKMCFALTGNMGAHANVPCCQKYWVTCIYAHINLNDISVLT